jgi:hypothetical protein
VLLRLNDEQGDSGAATMQEQLQNEQHPTWRWLWERLLLPLSDNKDAGIIRAETRYLILLKKVEDNQSSEE